MTAGKNRAAFRQHKQRRNKATELNRRPAVFARLTFALAIVLPLAANAQYFGDSTQTFSSTVEEGSQRGYADVVRSYGMTTLLNAQAVNQIEQARKQYIENQMRAAQVYVDANRYMQEYRRSSRPAPLSLEQYVRLARDAAPEPLTATQLDQLTGMISWPAPLRKPEYEAFRRHIDRLFQERATGYAVYGEIPAACEQFAEQLHADIMQFPPGDYVAAKKFLESLAWNARGVQS
jgi:hypothetical protein